MSQGQMIEELLRNHHDEYLVEGGIVADEYRILAVFEGGGMERDVVFECPFYRSPTTIPSEFSLEEDQATHWRI